LIKALHSTLHQQVTAQGKEAMQLSSGAALCATSLAAN